MNGGGRLRDNHLRAARDNVPPSVETCKKSYAPRARVLRGAQEVAGRISRARREATARYGCRLENIPRAARPPRPPRARADAETKIPRACAPGRSGPLDARAGGPCGRCAPAGVPLRHCAALHPWATGWRRGSRAAHWRLTRCAPRARRAAPTACSARPPCARPEIAPPAPRWTCAASFSRRFRAWRRRRRGAPRGNLTLGPPARGRAGGRRGNQLRYGRGRATRRIADAGAIAGQRRAGAERSASIREGAHNPTDCDAALSCLPGGRHARQRSICASRASSVGHHGS